MSLLSTMRRETQAREGSQQPQTALLPLLTQRTDGEANQCRWRNADLTSVGAPHRPPRNTTGKLEARLFLHSRLSSVKQKVTSHRPLRYAGVAAGHVRPVAVPDVAPFHIHALLRLPAGASRRIFADQAHFHVRSKLTPPRGSWRQQ